MSMVEFQHYFLRQREKYGARILLYHRIAEVPYDPYLLCVSPQCFREQLEVLRKHCFPVSLRQLVKLIARKTVPTNAVAVTFDDGYADNLHNAKPLLEKYDIPATVFVTSNYIGSRRRFWWDELVRLLLQATEFPDRLSINIRGTEHSWKLGPTRHYQPSLYLNWNALDKHNPSKRHRIFRWLYQRMCFLPEKERWDVLEQLRRYTGISGDDGSCRPLSRIELIKLAQGVLIEIGAHTLTHALLSALPEVAQRREIQGSKEELEQILGCAIKSFAYPYGSIRDYSAGTVSLVKKGGFECACSNFSATICGKTDHFQLPRRMVLNQGRESFKAHLGL